jgi:hypothetical protein
MVTSWVVKVSKREVAEKTQMTMSFISSSWRLDEIDQYTSQLPTVFPGQVVLGRHHSS